MGGGGGQGSVSRIRPELKSCQRVDLDDVKTKAFFKWPNFSGHRCSDEALDPPCLHKGSHPFGEGTDGSAGVDAQGPGDDGAIGHVETFVPENPARMVHHSVVW